MNLVRFFPTLFLLLFAVTSTARARPVPQTEAEEGTVPVHAIALSPNGKYLAVSSTYADENEKTLSAVDIWDLTTGQLQSIETKAAHQTNYFVFSPDSKRLALNSYLNEVGNVVEVLEVATVNAVVENHKIEGETWNPISHLEEGSPGASPWAIAFTADSKQIVGTSTGIKENRLDTGICVWNAATGKLERSFKSMAADIPVLALVDKEQSLLTLTMNRGIGNQLLVLNAQSGKVTRSIPLGKTTSFGFCLAPDANTLARHTFARTSRPVGPLQMSEQYVELRDWRSDHPTWKLKLPDADSIHMQFTPDSKQLLSVGRTPRHTLWRWDVASGEQLRTIELSDYAVPGPFKYAFSADAKLLAMPGPQGKIQLRNTSDGEIVQEFELLSEDGE